MKQYTFRISYKNQAGIINTTCVTEYGTTKREATRTIRSRFDNNGLIIINFVEV